jgi:hypothetical protein
MRKTICDDERLQEEFSKEIFIVYLHNKEKESNEKIY